ncbi:MAG: hypothetical protein GX359_01085 [Clostridiales bacterium]|nr:hypothetical protein [Clostridiales bacterium]
MIKSERQGTKMLNIGCHLSVSKGYEAVIPKGNTVASGGLSRRVVG